MQYRDKNIDSYLYQKLISIFIKNQNLSLSKIKFCPYQNSNSISIKNQILSISKIKF